MTDKDRFLELLAKKKFNNSTINDIAELNQLCKKYNINIDEYEDLDLLFKLKFIPEEQPSKESTEKSWERFRLKLNTAEDILPDGFSDKRPLFRIQTIKIISVIAAAAIIMIILNFGFFSSGRNANKLNIISTKYGSKSKVQMPDGTQIWLNGGSKITYDDKYGIKNRTVNLVGEAYFDVHHDEKHPFIIHTKKLVLKVLGTAFNVRAYEEDESSEATLVRGSLEVSFNDRPTEKIVLKPNEKLSLLSAVNSKTTSKSKSADTKIEEASPLISVSQVNYVTSENVIEEVAWIDNKLVFRKKPFVELAADMERRYDIKIEIRDKSILFKKFTGTFKNETFIEALNVLKETYPFSYTYNKTTNTVIIQPTN